MKTRFAPTLNGYLHIGNVYNLIWIELYSKALGLEKGLRIDDYDQQRCRTKYLDQIFKVLETIGWEWRYGPNSVEDFYSNHSSTKRIELYKSHFQRLSDSEKTFWCECTRSMQGGAVYDGRCREARLNETELGNQLRFNTKGVVELGVQLEEQIGDFLVWTRDKKPTYQLASIVDDMHYGYDFLIRGKDLYPSSAAQVALSKITENQFKNTKFIHHKILTKADGSKISKTQNADDVLDLIQTTHGRIKLFSSFLKDNFELQPDANFQHIGNLSELYDWLKESGVHLA